MSDFINAEIRIDRFNSLIRALKKRSKNLKPVMSVIGNLDSPGNPREGPFWAPGRS